MEHKKRNVISPFKIPYCFKGVNELKDPLRV